jgi:predicted amidohydrolase YtcJ
MATLLCNGTVLTMVDGARSDLTAIVVRDGVIAGTGSDREMTALAGSDAETIDLRGATVMPGLIDTHPHLMHFGVTAETHVDLSDATSHEDIVARIAARAAVTPEGQWILTTPIGEPHYFIRRSWRDLKEGELPRREVLDRAAPRHPVMLQAWAPVIPNVCALNSEGLRRFGMTRRTPDRVSNVWIEKDAAGEPTGILRGSVTNYYTGDPYMDELLRQLPRGGLGELLSGTKRAMRAYNAMGVTAIYEGHVMDRDLVGAYMMLRKENALSVRVLCATEAEAYVWSTDRKLTLDEYHAHLEEALAMRDVTDDWLRVNGITIERGGPCWPGFLRMRDPYKGPYGEMTRGHAFVEQEKIRLGIDFCGKTGLRLNAIVAGIGEHDEFLELFEEAAKKYDIANRHWILQHVFFLEPEQARRYAALGIEATTSMSFSWGKGDMFAERIGESVLQHLEPLKRMLDAGMLVACGSDWGPKNIFEHIQLAQTHRFCGSARSNAGPAQAVNAEQALAMWTRDAARVLQWQRIGTLASGDHADLIVIDRNPLTARVEDLPATKVLRTVVGGRIVHDAGAL